MRLLYTLGIQFYALAVRIAAPFNKKASQLSRGWRHWERQDGLDRLRGARVAWFHASSLGEFEQARPVLELYKKQNPDARILLTFFSPSGYEVRKNYGEADVVCYLPPDTRRNARLMVEKVDPEVVFFVKYDFWFNYLQQLRKQGLSRHGMPTKVYLFSAIFRRQQYFFKWYGRWFARQLQLYSHIFVQNQQSVDLLHDVGMERCSIAGDTRFDRVNDIAKQSLRSEMVERFVGDACFTLMAGSSWPPDEELINGFVNTHDDKMKVILAPHLIDEQHLEAIERLFGQDRCVRYSVLKNDVGDELCKRNVLIIDNIGMLSSLYRYATVAYIGGGFGKGIHNTLEAAVYEIPILFGPNYQKFQEARDLLSRGAAFTFDDGEQLRTVLEPLMADCTLRQKAAKACKDYMMENIGSTKTIMEKVSQQ